MRERDAEPELEEYRGMFAFSVTGYLVFISACGELFDPRMRCMKRVCVCTCHACACVAGRLGAGRGRIGPEGTDIFIATVSLAHVK